MHTTYNNTNSSISSSSSTILASEDCSDNYSATIVKKYSEILTDAEIECLSKKELKERLKNSQITVINKQNQIKIDEDRVTRLTTQYQDALTQATGEQAVNNLAANKQNRQEMDDMGTETKLCTVGRIAALVVTVVSFIITIICIVL